VALVFGGWETTLWPTPPARTSSRYRTSATICFARKDAPARSGFVGLSVKSARFVRSGLNTRTHTWITHFTIVNRTDRVRLAVI